MLPGVSIFSAGNPQSALNPGWLVHLIDQLQEPPLKKHPTSLGSSNTQLLNASAMLGAVLGAGDSSEYIGLSCPHGAYNLAEQRLGSF